MASSERMAKRQAGQRNMPEDCRTPWLCCVSTITFLDSEIRQRLEVIPNMPTRGRDRSWLRERGDDQRFGPVAKRLHRPKSVENNKARAIMGPHRVSVFNVTSTRYPNRSPLLHCLARHPQPPCAESYRLVRFRRAHRNPGDAR